MGFITIPLETYPRRQHLAYFALLAYPYVGVTNNVDVTELVQLCKRRKISFYLMFMHAAALAADGVPELRQRLHGGEVREYDQCPTSHTELLDSGAYCYCTLHHHMGLEEYLAHAESARAQCRRNGSIAEDEDCESMFFISTLPWLHYTALIQPVAGSDESNPRITWGKFEPDASGRQQLPVTLLAHHGLVDGIHIARFYENLNRELRALAE